MDGDTALMKKSSALRLLLASACFILVAGAAAKGDSAAAQEKTAKGPIEVSATKAPIKLTLRLREVRIHEKDSLWVQMVLTCVGPGRVFVGDDAFYKPKAINFEKKGPSVYAQVFKSNGELVLPVGPLILGQTRYLKPGETLPPAPPPIQYRHLNPGESLATVAYADSHSRDPYAPSPKATGTYSEVVASYFPLKPGRYKIRAVYDYRLSKFYVEQMERDRRKHPRPPPSKAAASMLKENEAMQIAVRTPTIEFEVVP